jgi:DNA transposition AAA+ family ATPase
VIESLIPFPDEYGIALALIGNTKGYKSLMDAKTMQINSRIGGALVFVEIPGEEDVDAILAAEGISGRLAREMCQVIGRQEGGLRTLYETIREARKLQKAAGAARLDERLLKLGAHNAGHWGAQS